MKYVGPFFSYDTL